MDTICGKYGSFEARPVKKERGKAEGRKANIPLNEQDGAID